MAHNKKSKKPIRNPIHIVFPKSGPVRKVEEKLPREQNSLELSISRKFLGALIHFIGIEYTDICSGSEPADVECKNLKGETIGIQIVEVVDKKQIELNEMRSSYKNALIKILGNDMLSFRGCRVTFYYLGEPNILSNVNSSKGKKIISILADFVKTLSPKVANLDVGKMSIFDTEELLEDGEFRIVVERCIAKDESNGVDVNCNGTGPSYKVGVSRGLLTSAVKSKIDLHYSRNSYKNFVLLAYSIDTLLMNQDPDVIECRMLLSTEVHPFDDSWCFFPYADDELGHIVHLWERTKEE